MNSEPGVPEYRIDTLHSRTGPWAVCIFVINEGARVRDQLRQMAAHRQRFPASYPDLLIADGGSTDGSLDLSFLQSVGVRTLLTKQSPGALSTQMRMAFDYILKEGYQGIVVLDGNGKDGVEAIPSFVQALEQGFDHIQGSRYLPGGFHEHTPFLRHWGVHLLHAPLISFAAGYHYTDTTNGFRAYSARLLKDPRLDIFRAVFRAYEMHYYLAIEAPRLGFQCAELPVRRVYPPNEVPSKIKGMAGYFRILRTLFNCCAGRYRVKF